MELVYDLHLEMDPFYQDGKEIGIGIGIEKGKIEVIENLLLDSKISIDGIANIANLSENFVHSIQERLVREGRLSLIKRNGKLFRRKL